MSNLAGSQISRWATETHADQTHETSESTKSDASAPALEREELLKFLNLLLEGERAGVKAAILCRSDIMDPWIDAMLYDVGCHEGRFCAMLTRHIERLGGVPSRTTGPFYEQLRAIQGLRERLAFLNRGQQWVIRKLDETLPAIPDASLRADLEDMRDVHVVNIGRCDALIAQVPAIRA